MTDESKKGRQSLNVELGPLKAQVLEAAERRGVRPAAVVRDAVALLLQEHASEAVEGIPSTRTSPRRGSAGRWVNLTLRLTGDEADALQAGALAERLSKNEYVGRLALQGIGAARLTALAALMPLAQALAALERELQAVGVRLQEPETQAEVLRVVREVRVQSRQVSALLGEVTMTRRQAGRRGA